MWDHLDQWTRYDLAEANQMLDDLGLAVGDDGFRQYSDGGRIEMEHRYLFRLRELVPR